MATPPTEVQEALTRLTAGGPDGYNMQPYNPSTNPYGFDNYGHKTNFLPALRDAVQTVFGWYLSAIEAIAATVSGYATSAGTSAASAMQSKLGIGYYGPVAASDETTPIIVGNGKVTFRMPYAYQLSEIRAALNVPQTSGAVFTVDVKRWTGSAWASIFSTPLTFDNGERTTVTAAVPAVLGTTTLADDDELRIDVTQAGDGTAKGLKVLLKGAVPA